VSDRDASAHVIFVLSDGTGETAQKVVRAALPQFSSDVVGVRTFPRIVTLEQLENLFSHAQESRALVVTTLVRSEMRHAAELLAIRYQVRHVDVLSPLLRELETFLDQSAVEVPNLLRKPDAHYFQRIEAIEYTVHADDGKDPRMLRDADIILVGVSRTGKTPLSTFLAHQGYKVGNQPIVLDRPPPAQLFEADPERVFALSIEPSVLQRIRTSRLEAMRMSEKTNYCDMAYILAELEYALDLYQGNKWPVIEVTNKAIEETASTILSMLQASGRLQVPKEPRPPRERGR
jgi:regulator of PEP synthase PpsR (kinase-PPPase family)